MVAQPEAKRKRFCFLRLDLEPSRGSISLMCRCVRTRGHHFGDLANELTNEPIDTEFPPKERCEPQGAVHLIARRAGLHHPGEGVVEAPRAS